MDIDVNEIISTAFWDDSPPELCEIRSIDVNYEKYEILIEVIASDEDSSSTAVSEPLLPAQHASW